MNGIKWRYI